MPSSEVLCRLSFIAFILLAWLCQRERESVGEVSIAFLPFQEGYGIQVCLSGCPFCVSLSIFHSFSLCLCWIVQLGSCMGYNCLTQVWAPLLYETALLSDKTWVVYLCPWDDAFSFSVFFLSHPATHHICGCGCICACLAILSLGFILAQSLQMKPIDKRQ